MKKVAIKNNQKIEDLLFILDDIIASGVNLTRGSLLSNLYTNFRNT